MPSSALLRQSRLCRSKALEGIHSRLQSHELLFINVDPHDFADPAFAEQLESEVKVPERVVIEITERTAIKDYPKFRERLATFRKSGYRFAVDDAGSRDAGLLISAEGAYSVHDSASLAARLGELLGAPGARQAAGDRALEVVRGGLGAAERSYSLVNRLLGG